MNKYSHRDYFFKISREKNPEKSNKSYLKFFPESRMSSNRGSCDISPVQTSSQEIFLNLIPNALNKNASERSLPLMNSLKTSSRSSSISKFSTLQNELISASLKKLETEVKLFHNLDISKKKQVEIKGEKEYTHLLNNLDKIIYPNNSKKPMLLTDLDGQELFIDEGQINYCKVFVRGRKTPMKVKIIREKGNVLTYVSFTDKEPGPSNSRYHRTDFFEVRENSTYFKVDFVYFGIKALEESHITIVINFKKTSNFSDIKKIERKNTQKRLSAEDYERIALKKHQFLPKNFIKINKSIKLLNSALNKQELSLKAETWRNKMKIVNEKKEKNYQLKKSKNIDLLNKKLNNIKQKFLTKEENEKILQLRKTQATWLKLCFFFKLSEKFHQIINSNRRIKLRRFTKNIRAIQIQKFYRKYSKKLTASDSLLIRAKSSLLFFKGSLHNIITSSTKKTLGIFLKNFSNNYPITSKFNNFISKFHIIQKSIKNYLALRNHRLKVLDSIWQQECQFYLFKNSSRKSIRKRQSVLLVTIPEPRKEEIIKNYYLSCIANYIKSIRQFYTSAFSSNSNGIFMSTIDYCYQYPFPRLKYIPSRETIHKLIEKAINICPVLNK